MNSILDIPFKTAELYPDRISHKFRTSDGTVTRTFKDLARYLSVLTAGLQVCGIGRKDHVGFFVNNRFEWIATDLAIMALGAVSIPRGSDTTPKEVQFIYSHSDSNWLILETRHQLTELLDTFQDEDWDRCKKIFIMDLPESTSAPVSTETPSLPEPLADEAAANRGAEADLGGVEQFAWYFEVGEIRNMKSRADQHRAEQEAGGKP